MIMAKSKRRTKKSGCAKVAGKAASARRTAPTSGLKDVQPPEPLTAYDEIHQDIQELFEHMEERGMFC